MERKAHFTGVGGIGMSALAQLMKDHGAEVRGSDREASPVTEMLEHKGIEVLIGQRAENVAADAEVLVYSEAVPADNPERAEAARRGMKQRSYFQMLGEVSAGKRTIAVAGTNGKTTTTGMLAKALADAGASPTAVVGSIVQDFGSNYLHGDSDLFVVEACEYKRDFLTLSPSVLVITNLEWDHTDYYPSLADVQAAFRALAEKVPADGTIVTDPGNPHIAPVLAGLSPRIVDYTKEPAYGIRLPGDFNAMNARAAASAARVASPGITDDSISASLSHFHGTWRRFQYKGKSAGGADVYDDYAHHPTAIVPTLKALRAKTAGKVVVAFHPHLYSRTKDLLDGFAAAFGDADRVLIAPIYAAREADDGSVSSELLAGRIRANGVDAAAYPSFDAIQAELAAYGAGDAVMTMGAGDIYKVADALAKC
jgi:UDP-N-acetylmuramate--alanine ligase